MSDKSAELQAKIANRTARVGVIGLGYVGLPLALIFEERGFPVTGFDVDPKKPEALARGESYIRHIGKERVAQAFKRGRIQATTAFDRLAECDAILVCVPTPLGRHREPDLSYVRNTADEIAKRLRPGQLVVLESTTYPGTTREELLPRFEARGLQCGKDFFLAFSPEREDPGNRQFNTQTIPKVVGGMNPKSLDVAVALYRAAIDAVVPVSSPEVAEAAKILENVFRAVNIALANELALMCDRLEISPWEVIEAASSKPFGFLPHYPGPGLGGDCIPVVPHFLAWRLREYGYAAQLIEAAHEINARMPLHVVQKVSDALNDAGLPIKGSRLLLLGVAYKANVHDTRESPSLEVMRQLIHRGGDVRYCDPWVESVELDGRTHRTVAWTADEVRAADCVVVLTQHREFVEEPHWHEAGRVVDTRNVVPPGPTVYSI